MGVNFTRNQVAKEKQRIETTRPPGFTFPLGLSFGQGAAAGSITTTAPQTQVGDSTVITFNSSADFTPDATVIGEYLIIAGGGSGAGGRPARSGGGGGGAGGLSFGIATFPAVKHTANVGGGGAQALAAGPTNSGGSLSTPGSDSHISRSSPSANVAVSFGGGRGGGTTTASPQYEPGGAGASGGGGCAPNLNDSTSPDFEGDGGTSSNTTQGSAGGKGTGFPNFGGGGGGGAGGEGGDAQATGITGSKGGIGLHFSISGANVAYAGGGGGGPYGGRANGSGTWIGGGPYGGANSSKMPDGAFTPSEVFGGAGLVNRGGGGGAGASGTNNPNASTGGGAGGSGVIILKISSSSGYFIT